ncbi:MAG TPA: polysaccharide biosynthesis tyrosine autokinase [Xenococcaceae cyanobacterium]|jgi:capsular exopolysaccharide synthesis family protein
MKSLQPSIRENYYWRIIKRHRILGTTVFILVSALGLVFTALREPVYQAQAQLKFKSSSFNSSLTDDNQFVNNLNRLINPDNFINTEIEVINSRPLIQETIKDLNQEAESDWSIDVETFRDNFTLKKLRNTNIVQLKYRDDRPEKAAEALNELIANYLDNNLAVNQEEAQATKQLIQEQLPQVEQKLQATEAAIRQIQEDTRVLVPQEAAILLTTNLANLQQQIAELQGQIANVNAQSSYIRSKLGMDSEQAIAVTSVGQSSEIQAAISQLLQLEAQLAQERSRFSENNPAIADLKTKIAQQQQLIQQKIQDIADVPEINLERVRKFGNLQQNLTAELVKLEASNLGLQQEIAALLAAEQAQQEKAESLPQVLQQIQQLERQLEASQADYEALRQQIRDVEIVNNPDVSNVRVVSYATIPNQPLRPDYLGYLAAIGLGLLAGMLLMALAEVADPSLKTIEAAKKVFGYTWLGIIPDTERSPFINQEQLEFEPTLPRVIVRDYPAVSASESYRMLQSNIKFLSTYKELKTIAVTSSVSQEGKSTVAANLACAMAQAGHKVLLVDANLHHPIQHRIWDTSNERGLSNMITEKLATSQVIQEVFPKLRFISAGTIPASPATLLDSASMKRIMQDWKDNYDFVIIDTPALDLAADAPILGRIADGILLVVKPENVNRSKANFAREIIQKSGQNILGIVFNKINPQVEPKNYFYHALEERPEDASQPRINEESKEELWLAISRMSRQFKKPKTDLTPEEILSTPVEQLQEIVNYLHQDLEALTQLVKEQEEELFMQRQMVKKLQKRVNLSRDIDRSFLEQQLAQEQEHKNMLNATLIGQRRNLERKQEILRQYHQALTAKQIP